MIFQFHYGTIKSDVARVISIIVCYFNSTMVRLKGNAATPRC